MSYTVVPLRIEEHRDALVNLWTENFDDPRMNTWADERFAWLYQNNPLDSARTWLAVETESNTVVGCGSVFRANKCIRGQVVAACVPVVFAVGKQHRTAAAALAIQRAVTIESCRMGFKVLLGRPSEQALPICCRVGYRHIGDIRDWARIIATEGELYSNSSSYTEEIVSAADERFDRLWEAESSRYQIVGEKTAAFLNWRYTGFNERTYRFYCLVSREDCQLVGYVVFYAMRKGFFIADLFCKDRSGPMLDRLLLGFACRMKLEGGQWIGLSFFGAQSFEDHLRRLGFSESGAGAKVVAYVDPDVPADLRNDILEKNNWFTFAGEAHVF
jgi:hypothetical protein